MPQYLFTNINFLKNSITNIIMIERLTLKLVLPLLFIGILLPSNIFAAVPVFETNASIISDQKITAVKSTGTFVESVTTAAQSTLSASNLAWLTSYETWKHNVFDVLLEYFKLKVLDLMQNQIIAWVSGDKSNPKFITNWSDFLGKEAATVRDILISEVDKASNGLLCNPFSLQVPKLVRPKNNNGVGGRGLGSQISCTLDKVVENIEKFYEDFNEGGWKGYAELIKPQNNIYGQISMLTDSQELAEASKIEAGKLRGLAGDGFLGTQKCITNSDGIENCFETVPAKVVSNAVNQLTENRFAYIVNSKQFASIASVVLNGFMNKLLESGKEGLLNFGSKSEIPESGFIPQGFNETDCESLSEGPLKDACIINRDASFENNSHLECVNNACTSVPGPGENSCTSLGSSCNTHLECRDNACIRVSGIGENQCPSIGESCSTNLPSIALTANPNQVTAGSAVTISWSVTNALNCKAESSWSGDKSITGGSESIVINQNSNFRLTCTGLNGIASKEVSANIITTSNFHFECQNNACVSVLGSGPNTCTTNSNCDNSNSSSP